MRVLILCVVALVVGIAAGRLTAPNPTQTYIGRRAWVLTQAAQRAPQGQVLLIGDSLSERSGIVSLCGRPVFDAGVSAAKLADMTEPAKELARTLHPSLTLIALGTNDKDTEAGKWQADLEALVKSLPKPVAIVEMKDGPLNAAMASVARTTGAKLVAMPNYPTVDGTHQSPAGAVIWRKALETACL